MFERDEQEISQIIEASFEAILSGESTLEVELQKHPELESKLRRELEIAIWLVSQREQVKPRPGFVQASRKRVVERIRQESGVQVKKRAVFGFAWPQRLALQSIAAVVVIVILVLSTNGVVQASADALPGEALYLAKRLNEQVTFAVTFDTARRVELSAAFAGRRLAEAEALMMKGDMIAAEAALEAYQEEVSRATVLVQQIDYSNLPQWKHASVVLQESLTQQADRLEILMAAAPVEIAEELEQAQELSIRGAAIAADTGTTIDVATRTPVPTVDPTNTSTPTVIPTQTPFHVSTQVYDPTATNTSIEEPAVTTEEEGAPDKKGPKPPNPNKPVDPGKPDPKDDNPSDSNKDK